MASGIESNGALITDFTSKENPERNNFLKRNRIIAGLSDATLVIESGITGGALITAGFADAYNRDVFALPGRANDTMSEGCNGLIKSNKAALIETAGDIQYFLGWGKDNQANLPRQRNLFTELTDEENRIIKLLEAEEKLPVDVISIRMDLPVSRISSLLLNLEFNGIVKVLPGNYYKLI
jgi:DNA processing protein